MTCVRVISCMFKKYIYLFIFYCRFLKTALELLRCSIDGHAGSTVSCPVVDLPSLTLVCLE